MKICLVSSAGGHLRKTLLLKSWWSKHDHFWICRNDALSNRLLKSEKVIHGYFPENRNIINLARNFFLAYKVLQKEKPDLIFSTGAGISIPFFVLGRIFGVKTIFMETFITIPHKTISGRINYFFSHVFIVQNKTLLAKYGKKARYFGPVVTLPSLGL